MAPTSDERREVALKMRESADSEIHGESLLATIVDICGIDFNFDGNVTLWKSTLTRLADLIDPN